MKEAQARNIIDYAALQRRSRRWVLATIMIAASIIASWLVARWRYRPPPSPVYVFVEAHREAIGVAGHLRDYHRLNGKLPPTSAGLPGPIKRQFGWQYLGEEGRKIGITAYCIPFGWDGDVIILVDGDLAPSYQNDKVATEGLRRRLSDLSAGTENGT